MAMSICVTCGTQFAEREGPPEECPICVDPRQYVGLSGQPGTYQEQHRVYGREGQACRRCRRSTVVRARYAGRSTFFCPRCQS